MEYNKNDIIKKHIYANAIYDSGGTGVYQFIHSDGQKRNFPEHDSYINLSLKRTNNIYEYIDTQKQENIYTIQRQNFNPQFIDQEFFKDTYRIKTTDGKSLTSNMIGTLRTKYFAEAYSLRAGFSIDRIQWTTDLASPEYGKMQIVFEEVDRIPNGSIVMPNYLRLTEFYPNIYPIIGVWIDDDDKIGAVWIDGEHLPASFPPGPYANEIATGDSAGFWRMTTTPIPGAAELVDGNPQTDEEIKEWFEKIGRNKIPSFSLDENEFTLDTLEEADSLFNNVVSHAKVYPIKINK